MLFLFLFSKSWIICDSVNFIIKLNEIILKRFNCVLK